jgi:hypothetical protein
MSATMGNNELTLALRLEGTTGAASVEVERLVDVAAMVATLPDPDIDPVFAAKLEQRLLTEGLAAQVAETPESYQGLRVVRTLEPAAPEHEEKLAPNVITLPRRRYTVRKAVAALIAAALGMALPVAMASTALPGSPGYALNKARFAVQLHFASGHEKPFMMMHRADVLVSYTSRLVVIGAPGDLINDTLAEAKSWMAAATASVIRTGKTGDIAKMRGMLERTGDLLRTMLPAADASQGDVVVLAEPAAVSGPAVEAIAASVGAPAAKSESSSKSSSEADKRDSKTPAAPKPPTIKDPGDGGKGATPGGCSNIGQAQLGHTLDPLSEQLCAGSPDNQRPN